MFSLELDKVSFSYGAAEPTLKAVSLCVERGERIAVLGESGVGKSSLLRVVAGLEKISSGTIHLQGQVVSSELLHVTPEHRRVGMVFQDWAVFPHLNVSENVGFGLSCRGHSPAGKERIKDLLERFELQGLALRSPSTLSGGQLQRVACARALAPVPQILLMDEAFSSLDVALRGRIRKQVMEALAKERTSCLMVTHDPQEAFECADRVFELREGTLHESHS